MMSRFNKSRHRCGYPTPSATRSNCVRLAFEDLIPRNSVSVWQEFLATLALLPYQADTYNAEDAWEALLCLNVFLK